MADASVAETSRRPAWKRRSYADAFMSMTTTSWKTRMIDVIRRTSRRVRQQSSSRSSQLRAAKDPKRHWRTEVVHPHGVDRTNLEGILLWLCRRHARHAQAPLAAPQFWGTGGVVSMEGPVASAVLWSAVSRRPNAKARLSRWEAPGSRPRIPGHTRLRPRALVVMAPDDRAMEHSVACSGTQRRSAAAIR